MSDQPPSSDVARTSSAPAGAGHAPSAPPRDAASLDRLAIASLENADEGLIIVDRDWRVVFANAAAQRFVQRPRADLLGYDLRALLPDARDRRFGVECRRAVAENVPVAFEEFYPDPLNAWFEVRAFPSAESLSILFRDVTGRRRIEEALRRSEAALQHANDELIAANEALRNNNETLEARVAERTADLAGRTAQLRALARDLVKAEEAERRKVAEVVHDQVQQLLSVARIKIEMARGQAASPAARKLLTDVDGLIAESLAKARSLTAELRPDILHRSGLATALTWIGRWYKERFGLRVAVEADDDPDTDEETRVVLFRSVRELLVNVAKHAKVAKARVQLDTTIDGRARILVSDEGAGFDPEALRAWDGTGGGFGLLSLRERLEALGGRLEIDSAPGRGARFTIVGPPPEPAESRAPEPSRPAAPPKTRRRTSARAGAARGKKRQPGRSG